MKYSKKQERQDKKRVVRLILENPRMYDDHDITEVFYGKFDASEVFDGKTRMSITDFQSAGRRITDREEYVTRLIKELKNEKIIGNSNNDKLVITSFDKAEGRGYISGDAATFYRSLHFANGGKFKGS